MKFRAALSFAIATLALVPTPFAWGHAVPLPQPPRQTAPAPRPNLIPKEDRASYLSRVTTIVPPVKGLRAHVLGNQELFEIVWGGRDPLHVLGTRGEPVFHLSPAGVDANLTSPTTWTLAERFGRVPIPSYARFGAEPYWKPMAGPGPWRWYEHRVQWMRGTRPAVVGDGSRRTKIFDWVVPVEVRGQKISIKGTLEWLPNPKPLRDQRSSVSSPLLSAAIVITALALGALAGVYVRDRTAAQSKT